MPTIVDEPAARNSLSLRTTRHQTAGVRYPPTTIKPRAESAAAVPFFDSAEQTSGEATLDGDEPLTVSFAFSEPGYYQLRFSFTGDDAEPRDLNVGFLVEDAPSGTSAAEETVDVTASQGCLDPVAIARDLNGINKELQALDKAVGDTEKKALALVGKQAGKDAAASATQATTSPSAPNPPGNAGRRPPHPVRPGSRGVTGRPRHDRKRHAGLGSAEASTFGIWRYGRDRYRGRG